jgi:hypothetical protein
MMRSTHSVVKFIVKVKLMENNVNSHVGSVIVVKVISQKSAPGMMLKSDKTSLPKEANMDEMPLLFCERGWTTREEDVATALLMTELKLCAARLTPCARVGEASCVSMVEDPP